MIEPWEKISGNIAAKFDDPEFYRNSPGTPLPELIAELETLFQKLQKGLYRKLKFQTR